MKFSRLMAFLISGACASFFMAGCSEEKSEPLPKLPSVELPKNVEGLYSGSMPCDDCTMKLVRLTLDSSKASAIQTTVIDTVQKVDTLVGAYTMQDSVLKVAFPSSKGGSDSVHWDFLRTRSGNIAYMTSAGSVYEDADGNRSELIRILRTPVLKAQKKDSAEVK